MKLFLTLSLLAVTTMASAESLPVGNCNMFVADHSDSIGLTNKMNLVERGFSFVKEPHEAEFEIARIIQSQEGVYFDNKISLVVNSKTYGNVFFTKASNADLAWK